MTVKLLVWRDDSSVNTSLYIQSEPNEGTETMIPDLLADSHLQLLIFNSEKYTGESFDKKFHN